MGPETRIRASKIDRQSGAGLSATKPAFKGSAKYISAIVILVALSFAIILEEPGYDIIGIITLATAIALVPYLGSKIYRARGKIATGLFLGSYVAQSVFAFVFLFGLAGLPYVVPQFSEGLPALLVFINAILLWRFGGMFPRAGASVPLGMFANNIGGALFLFLIFQLFAFFAVWAGYAFLYAAIAYGALSVSPLIAYSNRFSGLRNAGEYLLNSTARWTAVAFLLGLAATILSIPGANIYTYVVVLVIAAIVLGYVALRIYSLGSSRLQSLQENLYSKHAHEVLLVTDESFDYLRAAIEEFVKTGSKSDLTIALANLLTNAGMDYGQIRSALHLLSSYELPEIFRSSYLSLGKTLELEMQRRIGIVQLLMNSVAAEASARGKR